MRPRTRPLPQRPRLLTRRPALVPRRLLACPRLSPEWELHALRALLKPQTADAIRHGPPTQPWPAGAAEVVTQARDVVADRLGFRPVLHILDSASGESASGPVGDYWMVAEVPAEQAQAALALAAVISCRLPDLWFVIDRLFVRAGQFHRRRRGHELHLVPAKNVHLPRPIRAALRGLL